MRLVCVVVAAATGSTSSTNCRFLQHHCPRVESCKSTSKSRGERRLRCSLHATIELCKASTSCQLLESDLCDYPSTCCPWVGVASRWACNQNWENQGLECPWLYLSVVVVVARPQVIVAVQRSEPRIKIIDMADLRTMCNDFGDFNAILIFPPRFGVAIWMLRFETMVIATRERYNSKGCHKQKWQQEQPLTSLTTLISVDVELLFW